MSQKLKVLFSFICILLFALTASAQQLPLQERLTITEPAPKGYLTADEILYLLNNFGLSSGYKNRRDIVNAFGQPTGESDVGLIWFFNDNNTVIEFFRLIDDNNMFLMSINILVGDEKTCKDLAERYIVNFSSIFGRRPNPISRAITTEFTGSLSWNWGGESKRKIDMGIVRWGKFYALRFM